MPKKRRENGYVAEEHDLRIDSNTPAREVLQFVEERTKNPIVIDDTTIFCYNTHTIHEDKLRKRVSLLYRDAYIIPFQLGSVWAFMTHHIPEEVRKLELLVYDEAEEDYYPHRNYARVFGSEKARSPKLELHSWVEENKDDRDGFELSESDSELKSYL